MTEENTLVDGELFLGRVEAQNEFRQALRLVMAPDQAAQAPYIFLITGNPGMGNLEIGFGDDSAAVQEDIEIEGTCPPAHPALPTMIGLQRLQGW